ncbi:CAP domain-containing protein [Halalkalibacter akibai]|uniref:Allergen V5/Tpx-1 related n=1 Tax=Halalkalibacter akibai (strain ATCC 43226 / DSM 21942 / CIP 109018 / JCM 9157 / 1139) TaxID=1236973 RepID=W4QQ87_HALA3|nr:CAP domain-containing protein [Halalkalibacter akibai]GAE33823.1 allergen V5/Tpx-1 related [Halalkalibacter akibai JCM 9157]
MKKTFLFLVCIIILISIVAFEQKYEEQISQWFQEPEAVDLYEEEMPVEEVTSILEPEVEEELFVLAEHERFIGLTSQQIKNEFGEPSRIDLSAYGYDWWIYPMSSTSYMQIGIADNEVVTVFLTGEIREQPFSLGTTYEELNDFFHFERNVDVRTTNGGIYQFELTSEDVLMRPLTQVDGHWVQFYFDTYTNELSSIRMINDDILVKQRPYSVSYIGAAPERPSFSSEEWEKIEVGNARQIFDFTNVIRARHQLDSFLWEENVADVAYLHSKDMSENNYFSHTSPTFGEISDRFERGEIPFRLAGENIAAKYIDGLASVEGWLNSEGHRVNLLHEDFTHLGVGVFQDYYTQNFLTPWQL